jgi:hypothetical protein
LNFVGLFFRLDLIFQRPFCRGLVEPGIEQSETHVTERENAGNEKDALTPTKKPLRVSWDELLLSYEFHGR